MITGLRFPSPFERIVELEISEKLTEAVATHRLILEVAGSRSNLVLVSCADDSILGCAYQVSMATSVRPLQLSSIYRPPPSSQGKLHPLDLNLQSFSQKLTSFPTLPIAKALCETVRGMSPNIAAVILKEADVVPQVVQSLAPDHVKTLYSLTSSWAGAMNIFCKYSLSFRSR